MQANVTARYDIGEQKQGKKTGAGAPVLKPV